MAETNRPFQFKNFPSGPSWYMFWEDWDDEYTGQSTSPAAGNRWIQAALNSGTFAQTTDEQFGVAVLSGAATTDNSGIQLQADMEQSAFLTGKVTEFICRLKSSDATQDEWYCGLGITDTTFLDGTGTLNAGLTHSDSVGFYKPDGGTDVYLVVRRDGTNVVTISAGNVVAGVYSVFAFRAEMSAVAGTGVFRVAKDGDYVTTGGGGYSTVVPYSAEEILTPTVAFLTGDNVGTKSLTIDYLGVLIER